MKAVPGARKAAVGQKPLDAQAMRADGGTIISNCAAIDRLRPRNVVPVQSAVGQGRSDAQRLCADGGHHPCERQNMNYTDEQRAIVQRISQTSVRLQSIVAAQKAAQATQAENLLEAVMNLTTAIECSNELLPVFQEYGDLFREFLDTL
jgi:hypothetical protein